MYGATMSKAMDRYLIVDEATKNFGYKRMQYNINYNLNFLNIFIKEHGLPEMIFEYENEKGRNGIKMYYMKENVAYVFEYRSWKPDSLYLKEQRAMTEYEKLTYEELMKKGKPIEKAPSVTGSIMDLIYNPYLQG